jgi:ABC-type polysaccharide/polyol phosphate export permease
LTLANHFESVFLDLWESLKRYRFWFHLGQNDIRKQYRRSFLGPVWITLNTSLFAVVFSLVGAQLFKQDLNTYLPYFFSGVILFGLFTSIVNEGCTVFIGAESYLKQAEMPKMTFAFQLMTRNAIMFLHNFVVVLIVLLLTGNLMKASLASFATGLLMTFYTGLFVSAILGALAARFRDIPMMVSSVTHSLFFVTPVFWQPEQLTDRAKWLVALNPFAAYLDLLQAPLLGQDFRDGTLAMVAFCMVLLPFCWMVLFVFARRRIVYWL